MRFCLVSTIAVGLVTAPALSFACAEPEPYPVEELTMQLGDADPALRLQGAIALCYSQWGNYAGQRQFMEDVGWTYGAWGGLEEYTRDTTQVLMSQDFFCDVSDSEISQTDALGHLGWVLEVTEQTGWIPGENEMGCFELSSARGHIVVSSAGQDPVCTPTNDSAIRFWMGQGN